ncbi:MAG: SUF system NifU family Fe-S cluster assembly protein [Spirochaetales bacterium]|nr:SUF system NifU family Fe-S cluster assembly protein [Spirochaetales bacterium]
MQFDDLYQEIILDHYRNPRNRKDLSSLPPERILDNPTCGDSVCVDFDFDDSGRLRRVVFDGDGCAISMASASMMTEYLRGLTKPEILKAVSSFIACMRGEGQDLPDDLAPLAGIRQFPMRVKCATLAWHAARQQLGKENSGE